MYNSVSEKADKKGYDKLYKEKLSAYFNAKNKEEFTIQYERSELRPLHRGGRNWFGYTRNLAVQRLMKFARDKNTPFDQITVLDAGCGLGDLSIYLASKGFYVVGVDISRSATEACIQLAKKMEVEHKTSFFAMSLEDTALSDKSIDFIIGHGSMHHFIKYEKVPDEFRRIMKNGACGCFAESFGENRLYHMFHDKKTMKELGDVVLTRRLIYDYLKGFEVTLTPTDWIVMFDKFLLRYLPRFTHKIIVKLSKISFLLDRKIPAKSPFALYLSNSVLVEFKNKTVQKND